MYRVNYIVPINNATGVYKMTIELIETVEISEHFIPALIYGDYTTVHDDEMGLVQAYAESLANCVLEVVSEHYDLNRCLITGLISETVTVNIWK